mmetsp:Transcript_4256/g.8798  ORF Transcript_4256/g.8798 Transcript_4256/m.8798 type:complete len:692 (+) Transcript_4256:230-2305(+)
MSSTVSLSSSSSFPTPMPMSSSSSSPPSTTKTISLVLEFLLKLTKFAGQNKVPILEWVLAWTTVVVFGIRYLIDYARLRWKLYRLASMVVRNDDEYGYDSSNSSNNADYGLCDRISLCPLAHTRAELSVTAEARWERLRSALLVSSSVGDSDGTATTSAASDGDRTDELIRSSSSNDDNGSTDSGCCSSRCSSDTSTGYSSSTSTKSKKQQAAASRIAQTTKEWTDEDWIRVFRSDLDVRREASYLMRALRLEQAAAAKEDVASDSSISTSSTQQQKSKPRQKTGLGALAVLSKLWRLWPQLLELPESVVTSSTGNDNNNSNDRLHDISLIVPMYKERVTDIGYTLNRAFHNCKGDPKTIQVVVVHVQAHVHDDENDNDNDGSLLRRQLLLQQHEQQQQREQNPQQQNDEGNDRTNELSSSPSSSPPSLSSCCWGELNVVLIPFGEGGGRGKTLNIGAKHATAPILTFLHADIMVPTGWDQQIKRALSLSENNNNNNNATTSGETNARRFFPHACAFTMAIDDGNNSDDNTATSSNKALPAGLLGAEWLGVLRCHCGLPYGDSVLSFGRPMFDYMGGYPEQPLMEDYEAMDWLRLRSVLLSTIHKNKNNNNKSGTGRGAEGLVLLPGRAKCSPRRWQKYGVAYTSLINAMCIFRYSSNATAEDLFDFYYHCNNGGRGGGGGGAVSKKKEQN